jgi:hypothetical protein
MNAATESRDGGSPPVETLTPVDSTNLHDEERGLGVHNLPLSVRRPSNQSTPGHSTELRKRPSSAVSSKGGWGFTQRKASQFLDAVSSSSSQRQHKDTETVLAPKLAALVQAYIESDVAATIRRETADISNAQQSGEGMSALPDVAVESLLLRGRKRASWGTQFRILSGRAFKNLYRDPALLTAHYLSSIALACECVRVLLVRIVCSTLCFAVICGLFFHNVT